MRARDGSSRSDLASRALTSLTDDVSEVNLSVLRVLYVFPSAGVTFNRVKKAANTSMMRTLHEFDALCAARAEASGASDGADPSPSSVLKQSPEVIRRLPAHEMLVVRRNPYTRVLAAFLDRFRHRRYRRTYGAFDIDPLGFQSLLRRLDQCGIMRDPHWSLQVDRMVLPPRAYTRVIDFEDCDRQMRTYLTRRGVPAEVAARMVDQAPGHSSYDREAAAHLHDFYSCEAADVVARLYERDFQLLGYGLDLGDATNP